MEGASAAGTAVRRDKPLANLEQHRQNDEGIGKMLTSRTPASLVGPPYTYLLADGNIRTFVLEMQIFCKIIVTSVAWPRFSHAFVLVRNSAIPHFFPGGKRFLGVSLHRLHRLAGARGFLLWFVPSGL